MMVVHGAAHGHDGHGRRRGGTERCGLAEEGRGGRGWSGRRRIWAKGGRRRGPRVRRRAPRAMAQPWWWTAADELGHGDGQWREGAQNRSVDAPGSTDGVATRRRGPALDNGRSAVV